MTSKMDTVQQVAENLVAKLVSVAAEQGVAATVSLAVEPPNGIATSIEVRPAKPSQAPVMTIWLADRGGEFTIGQVGEEFYWRRPEKLIQSLGSLAEAMFRGQIEQTVVRTHSGRAIQSLMRVPTGKPLRDVWTTPWFSAFDLLLGRHRTRVMLAHYPRSEAPRRSV